VSVVGKIAVLRGEARVSLHEASRALYRLLASLERRAARVGFRSIVHHARWLVPEPKLDIGLRGAA
jgi:hypothetical protein